MTTRLLVFLAVLGLSACTSYHPLADPVLRQPIGRGPAPRSGVKITFLGNTTLLIDDGHTFLLVDGFLSRPGPVKTLIGRIAPEPATIRAELARAHISRVDGVIVGHAHYDHALDATLIADSFGAQVAGSRSFGQIYRGLHSAGSGSQLIVVPPNGRTLSIGRFTVRFAPSEHVGSHSFVQRAVEGEITAPVTLPARYSAFKCGDVFALHITHPEGNVAVTTSAGSTPGQLRGRNADVLCLGVALMTKESPNRQDTYWRETVEATNPDVIVPIHWDNFTRKLSRGLKPLPLVERSEALMDLVKRKAHGRAVRVLDLRESIWIHRGQVRS